MADPGPFCHDKVALISETGVCNARTSFRFPYTHPGSGDFEATALEGAEECLSFAAAAVIGVHAEAIRLISPEENTPAVPKDMESKARALL
ncbi:MAG TPA: hypothetical protein VK463_20205, partial [Desulfomonilaceae bacterium]|nr:hypothetical protein [Desulfomonilaceae bacterium]